MAKISPKYLTVHTRERTNWENEARFNKWQENLTQKQLSVDNKANQNKLEEYNLNKDIFSKIFCKDFLIIQLGKDFWIEQISKMFVLGKMIGKNELNVISDLDCFLVNIYDCFGMYEEAYNALCVQAEYGSWLNLGRVEDIVRKSQHWIRLIEILEKRINPGFDKTKNDFLML